MKNTAICYQAYYGFGYFYFKSNRVMCCLKTEKQF